MWQAPGRDRAQSARPRSAPIANFPRALGRRPSPRRNPRLPAGVEDPRRVVEVDVPAVGHDRERDERGGEDGHLDHPVLSASGRSFATRTRGTRGGRRSAAAIPTFPRRASAGTWIANITIPPTKNPTATIRAARSSCSSVRVRGSAKEPATPMPTKGAESHDVLEEGRDRRHEESRAGVQDRHREGVETRPAPGTGSGSPSIGAGAARARILLEEVREHRRRQEHTDRASH